MATTRSHLKDLAQYAAVRTAVTLLHCFDVRTNLATATGVGSLFCRLHSRHYRRAIEHIADAFPDWPTEQCERVAMRSIENMFRIFMVDAMVMPRLVTKSTWPQYIRIGNLKDAMDHFIRDKPAVFITGHCGNWELLGYALAVLDYPLFALARPIDNPLLNDWLLGVREARGMRIITKWGAIPVLQTVLRTNGRAGFIADQDAGEQGLFVPFFGRLASSYKAIGLLALRYNVPIMGGFARRIGDRFEYELSTLDIIRPQDWADHPDPLFYITARYTRAIENAIRQAPDQYLWAYRRWKSRPRHERTGRPMPSRLIAKLESLPWLTPHEVQRIVDRSNQAARRQAR